ncbi:MAG: SufD family Fe-S cluster assembly protein, partial [Pseudomonadota bacterium]
MQRTAAEEALGLNLPTRRVESFHYTDLRALIQEIPEEASATDAPKTVTPVVDSHQITFADGRLSGEQILPSGVMLSAGANKAGSTDINDAIVSINNAISGDAVEIVVSGNSTTEKPLCIGHMSSSEASSAPYHKVTVKENAQAQVIEQHASAPGVSSLSTVVSELILEKNSKAQWFIVQQESNDAKRLARLNVKLAEGADLSVFILNAGGKLVRQ